MFCQCFAERLQQRCVRQALMRLRRELSVSSATLLCCAQEMAVPAETLPQKGRSPSHTSRSFTGAMTARSRAMSKLALLAAAAAAATAAMMAAPASAQDATTNIYGNLGYTQFDTPRGDLGAVTGRLGYQFTPYLSAEGEYSTGVNDSHEGKLSNAWGLYGRVGVPVSPNFDIFGRAGY